MGNLYGLIYLINSNTKIRIKTGKKHIIEVGETVRQGSVLRAVMNANSMESRTETANHGKAMASIDIVSMTPLCFQYDVAAMGDNKRDIMRNQNVIEVF